MKVDTNRHIDTYLLGENVESLQIRLLTLHILCQFELDLPTLQDDVVCKIGLSISNCLGSKNKAENRPQTVEAGLEVPEIMFLVDHVIS